MKMLLNGLWSFQKIGDSHFYPGTVPGSVYGDLLANGLMPDPFDQDNEYTVRELMNEDYAYERTFNLTPDQLSTRLFLRCDGLDTLAEITVNGRPLAATDNMHRRWRFPLEGFVNAGENRIRVVFRSCLQYIRRKNQECRYDFFQAKDAVRGFIHLRKGSSMFGWDWGPQLPDAGIWRDIWIESVRAGYLDEIAFRQIHQANGSVALKIRIHSVLCGPQKEHAVLAWTLNDPHGTILHSENLPAIPDYETDWVVPHADKWYPVGYGKQPLYHFSALLKTEETIDDEAQYPLGLREVRVKKENDQWGQSFTFVVNGVEIFGKGSDYIPEDNLLGRTNREKTQDLLLSAIKANHNMIRVWGGGIYPADYFFDLCDQLGLMVWQDLMFACAVYDMDDQPWVETMKAEIRDNLQRIRHHACLSLICGNNENETAIENWGVPSRDVSMRFYVRQYEETIAPIVAETVPDIEFWPSSPSSGGGFRESNADGKGDMHYWGVWHNNEPIQYYRKYFPRFMSEFGIQSFPSVPTIRSFAREEDLNIFSYIMEQHQKNNTANEKILNYVGKMFRYPKDFSSLVYVSQLIQAEGIRYGVEHWRRHYGRCMGALYWQLNDCWPVASWSGIDYFHRWKVLHYHSKKFFQPILASICEEGTHAELYVTNETLSSFKGILNWELQDLDGKILEEGTAPALIPKQSARKIAEVDFELSLAQKQSTVLWIRLESGGRLVSENQVSFVPDKHLRLKKGTIRTRFLIDHGRPAVGLTANTFMKYVELSLNRDLRWEDNYFYLIPGQERIVAADEDVDLKVLEKELKIRSLVDTY
jgi:beta-mannosidase